MPITIFKQRSNANRIYFNLAGGKFNYKKPDNRDERLEADAISGVLIDITEKETTFGDATIKTVEFHLKDVDLKGNHYEYILPINKAQSNFKRILMYLATVKDFRFNQIEFVAYLDKEGKYTRISIRYNGEKLCWLYDYNNWVKEIEQEVEGEIVKIRKPMNDFYEYLLNKVKAALKGEPIEIPEAFKSIPRNPEVESKAIDDMPTDEELDKEYGLDS